MAVTSRLTMHLIVSLSQPCSTLTPYFTAHYPALCSLCSLTRHTTLAITQLTLVCPPCASHPAGVPLPVAPMAQGGLEGVVSMLPGWPPSSSQHALSSLRTILVRPSIPHRARPSPHPLSQGAELHQHLEAWRTDVMSHASQDHGKAWASGQGASSIPGPWLPAGPGAPGHKVGLTQGSHSWGSEAQPSL